MGHGPQSQTRRRQRVTGGGRSTTWGGPTVGPARSVDNGPARGAIAVRFGPKGARADRLAAAAVTYRDAVPPGRPERAALPLPVALPVAATGGLALDAAFPEPGIWPLAAAGLAALVVAAAGRRTIAAAGVGLLTGLTFFGPLLAWAGVYVGWIAWVPLAVLEALYVAVFAAGVPWLLRAPFGGFGWGRLAFSQADGPALGLAALGGAPLVSFAVALAGTALAVGVLALLRRRRAWPLVVAALAGAAVLATGLLVPTPVAAEHGQAQVAAVQGDVPRPGLDFNAERRAVLDNHARGTTGLADEVAAGRAPAPDVVIWPENASDIDPLRNADAAQVVDAAAEAVGAPLLVGAVLRRDDDRLSNTTLVWEPGEGPVDRYVKQRPVPFAEYVPYRAFFRRITSAVDLVPRDFVAGGETGVLTAAGVPIGVQICFEVVEDALVRDSVRDGAQLLTVQANNATFGYTDESVQQLAMSRLRAVEHGPWRTSPRSG